MKTQVFISYAREDITFAEKINTDLIEAGVKTWIDFLNLIPGQNWEMTIKQALKESRYIITLLSSHSVSKKGFVQKEIRYALDIAQEFPPNTIYIIPLRINECKTDYEGLNSLQMSDFFPDYNKCFEDLLRVFEYESIEKQALIKIDHFFRRGIVARLTDKGFGFVENYGTEKDLFFHASELNGIEFESLKEGDLLKFKMGEGPKGPLAMDIQWA